MAVDEARLRASLREVFARLDIDGSGAVSTREMRRMTDELGMEMSGDARRTTSRRIGGCKRSN